jgi:NitT/TauT family transport system ATP-binding protein
MTLFDRATTNADTPSRGAISIRGVSRIYGAGEEAVEALSACSFDVAPGQFVAIVGPSGCGKSTLINILAGFDGPSAGRIDLDGQTVAAPDLRPTPGPERLVVFQHGALFPWMSVLDNVAYGPIRRGRLARVEARREARELLERLHLGGHVAAYPGQISSGAQRRVEIARALMNDPAVLILDEPFRAMDSITKQRMHAAVLEMHALIPKTVLFVTHDLDEALLLSDRVVVMTTRPGRIKLDVAVDQPRPRSIELAASPAFLALKRQTHAAVHEEARKAFAAGERELA